MLGVTKQAQERFDTWKSKCQSLCGPLIFEVATYLFPHELRYGIDLNFKIYNCLR